MKHLLFLLIPVLLLTVASCKKDDYQCNHCPPPNNCTTCGNNGNGNGNNGNNGNNGYVCEETTYNENDTTRHHVIGYGYGGYPYSYDSLLIFVKTVTVDCYGTVLSEANRHFVKTVNTAYYGNPIISVFSVNDSDIGKEIFILTENPGVDPNNPSQGAVTCDPLLVTIYKSQGSYYFNSTGKTYSSITHQQAFVESTNVGARNAIYDGMRPGSNVFKKVNISTVQKPQG